MFGSEVVVKTGAGGEHHYFSTTAPVASRVSVDGVSVEVKGTGSYIVGVGSRHATGVIYDGKDSWRHLPDLPEGLASVVVARKKPGKAAAKAQDKATGATSAPDASGGQPEALSATSAIHRAKRYLRQVEPRHRGERNTTLNRTAFRLIQGFGLSEDDALTLFLEWGSRCTPPMKPQEIEATVKSAASRSAAERYCRTGLRACFQRPPTPPEESSSPSSSLSPVVVAVESGDPVIPDGVLSAALRLAERFHPVVPQEKDPLKSMTLTIMWALGRVRGGRFWLGCRTVGDVLGIDSKTAATLIKAIWLAGWVKRYRYSGKLRIARMAMEYLWIIEPQTWPDDRHDDVVFCLRNIEAFIGSAQRVLRGPPDG